MSEKEDSIFHRNDLAEVLVKRLLKPDVLTSRDGLFITGIRRVGKTTFIRSDLIPLLQKEGALAIYVDLWSNQESESASTIVLSKVRETLNALTSAHQLKEFELNLKIVKFSFSTADVGKKEGVSLSDAFLELIRKIDRNIVLIIDEVQETLKNESGRKLLMALKAARDAVNLRGDNPHQTHLLIVGTGSHRSFVSAMVSKQSQPFYAADRVDFPLLGEDFVRWQIKHLNLKVLPSFEALKQGFQKIGSRPNVFRQLLLEIQNFKGKEIDEAFALLAHNQTFVDAREFLEPLKNADALTQCLFTEIARSSEKGCEALYSKEFLEKLGKTLGKKKAISASGVQAKLRKMEKENWIFPMSHGKFAVTDSQAAAIWLAEVEDTVK